MRVLAHLKYAFDYDKVNDDFALSMLAMFMTDGLASSLAVLMIIAGIIHFVYTSLRDGNVQISEHAEAVKVLLNA